MLNEIDSIKILIAIAERAQKSGILHLSEASSAHFAVQTMNTRVQSLIEEKTLNERTVEIEKLNKDKTNETS